MKDRNSAEAYKNIQEHTNNIQITKEYEIYKPLFYIHIYLALDSYSPT